MTGFQLVKKISLIYVTTKFITSFNIAHHNSTASTSISYTEPNQFSSYTQVPNPEDTSYHSPPICTHLVLPNEFFTSGILTKMLYTPILSPTQPYTSRPSCTSRFSNRILLHEKYRSLSYLLCNFHHSPLSRPF